MKEKSAIGVIFLPTLRSGYRDAVPDLLYGSADLYLLTSWLPLLIRVKPAHR